MHVVISADFLILIREMGDCTALAIIPKRPRANTSDEEVQIVVIFNLAFKSNFIMR